MTVAQTHVIAALATKEQSTRKFACSSNCIDKQYWKDIADECLKAIGILKDAYEED